MNTLKFCTALIAAVVSVALSGCRVPYADLEDDGTGGTGTGSGDGDTDTDTSTDTFDTDVEGSCPSGSWDKFDNSDSPYIGGEVEVRVEASFSTDFRCPFCAMFAGEFMEMLNNPNMKKYVRFYFHHYPIESIHPGTTEVHAAAYAVFKQSQQKFWQLHDELFTRSLDGDKLTIEEVTDYAQNVLGVDMVQYEQVRNAQETYDFIEAQRQAAKDQGVTGTPSTFVCGSKLSSWGDFEETINEYLEMEDTDTQAPDAGI